MEAWTGVVVIMIVIAVVEIERKGWSQDLFNLERKTEAHYIFNNREQMSTV